MSAPNGARARLIAWTAHRAVRFLTAAHGLLLRVPRRRAKVPPADEGFRILLTGMFHSEAWVKAHLAPLAASRDCGRIVVVANDAVPAIEKVEHVAPSPLLVRAVGRTPARLVTFGWLAFRRRPHVVGGFHLLINGLVAVAFARLAGARSMFFCVGGTAEVDEGGLHGENRLFGLMPGPDPVVERRLLRAVDAADLVITMGTGAKRSFRERGVGASIHVIGGGMDPARFQPAPPGAEPEFDLVFVGRLAPIKRVDLFLDAVALVAARRPGTKAAVVGDGPLRAELEERASLPDLRTRVAFLGRQQDVGACLRRSRVFVLTSESEGLPLSAVEAMMCGLPVVAPAVGDLPDLVEEGVTGHLVTGREPEAFALAMLALLQDEERLRSASLAARRIAGRYTIAEASRRWDTLLAETRAAGDVWP